MMAERIIIEHGRHSWLPSGDAELVETFHHFDMPLIGVIRQGGALHLFRCVSGHVDSAQVWAYTGISEGELQTLLRADPDHFDAMVAGLAEDRPTVVALGNESRGLTLSILLANPGEYLRLLQTARAALDEALHEIDAILTRVMGVDG